MNILWLVVAIVGINGEAHSGNDSHILLLSEELSVEGSGETESLEEQFTPVYQLHSTLKPISQSIPLTSFSNDFMGKQSGKKIITKRSADYYNGIVDSRFYFPFDAQRPTFPTTAVTGLGRPLQRGSTLPRTEYVALWSPRGAAPHWGTVYLDESMKIEGTFIESSRIMNLTQSAGNSVRLLQYVGSQEGNNFKFEWVLARNADPSTVLTQRQSGLCSSRVAPAVFQDGNYEFLGEADIDKRIMTYIHQGHVNIVQKAQFTNNVYLLTKTRCRCSCG